MAKDDPENRPDAAGEGAVEHELERDVAVSVAERLERAGIDALLVDHAGHGRERDERGHEVEKDREDLGQRVDDLGDGVVGLVGLGT